MADGEIGAVIDTLEFDATEALDPRIIHIAGDVYAIVYGKTGVPGKVITVEVATDGQIGAAVIDSLEFDASATTMPRIVHVDGNIYAIAYTGAGSDGCLCTMNIAANGQIGAAVIDTLIWDASFGVDPTILHVSGDVYTILYHDWAKSLCITVSIESNGQIGAAVIDTLEYRPTICQAPEILHVSGDVYAIVDAAGASVAEVTTIEIAVDGQIGAAVIDTLALAQTNANPYYSILHVFGNIFAIAYEGTDNDGWLCTVNIAANGQIGAAEIDTLEFDAVTGLRPNMVAVGNGIFAIAYEGNLEDGWLCTANIANDGQIDATIIDSLEFDEFTGLRPKIVHVDGDIYAIAYRGVGDDGWLCTVDISTPPEGRVHHEMIMGIG